MADVVLVTRPEPGGSETAARLEARGYRPLLTPCLRIAPVEVRLPAAAGLQAILATSGQAVARLDGSFHATRLLAVGDATARRAREAGFAEVLSAGGNAGDLRRLAVSSCDPAAGPLLLAVGARQGGPLAADLRAAGFRVVRRVVYAARPARRLPAEAAAALRDGCVVAALFFSRETANSFAGAIPASLRTLLKTVTALAIAQPVADAILHLPWHSVRVALHPTQDELLALL